MSSIDQINTALLTEDYAPSRLLISEVVRTAFPDVEMAEAENLVQARVALSTHQFDLAMIDLNLPDGSGIDLIMSICTQTPETYCVVITTMDDDDSLFASLQAGAQGYLLKHESQSKLVSRLQGILQNDPPLSPSIARRILRHFNRIKITRVSLKHDLAPREVQVLELVAKGLQRKQIARDLEISLNTTSDYVKIIYRKLNVSSRMAAAEAARNLGIV